MTARPGGEAELGTTTAGLLVGLALGALLAGAAVVYVPEVRERLLEAVPPEGEESFSAEQLPGLYGRVYDGVVRFESEACEGASTGSGALVAPDLVLTAAHVVDDAASIRLLAGSHSARGQVVGFAPEDDLALVRADQPFPGHVFDVAAATPAVGSSVVALGYPLSGALAMTAPGVVSATGIDVPYEGQPVQGLMQMDLATNQGNSGGPVLDPSGRIVGIVSGQSQSFLTEDLDVVDVDGIKYAVPAGTISARLASWRSAPQTRPLSECGGDGLGPEPDPNLVTALVDDPETQRVVQMFFDYADGINREDYDRAYRQLSPRQRESLSLEEFEEEQRSSVLSDFVVQGFAREGDSLLARTAFTSYQAPEDAPDGSNLTCTFWSFDWVLVPGGPNGWQIDRSRGVDGQPKWTACSDA